MMLHVTPAALQDLKEIKEYISVTLCNPPAAERIIRNIISAYNKLPGQPFIGTILKSKINFDVPFRYLVSGNYLIFYQVTSDIEIHRIIYGRRDYVKILYETHNNTENISEDAET